MHKIFSNFIYRPDCDNIQLKYATWFVSVFPDNIFSSDDLLMYAFLQFCTKLNVPVKYNYLLTWMDTEMRKLLMARTIKVAGCESLSFDDPVAFEQAFVTTKTVMSDTFKDLEVMTHDVDDFTIEASAFITEKKSEFLVKALSESFNILQETNDSARATEYAMTNIVTVDTVFDESSLEELPNIKAGSSDSFKFVTDFGIPALDSDSKGVFTKQLFGVEAQPGAGKTRFTVGHPCYRASVHHKRNVCFWALEQSKAEVEAMLVARHVWELFHVMVNDELIVKHIVPEDLKQYVEAARIDLFESSKYGHIYICDDTLYAETIYNQLRSCNRLHGPFDMIAVDYMGMIESNPGPYQRALSEAEAIGRGYKYFKRFCRINDVAGIAVGQFNRYGISAGEADKDITPDMAQGGIAVYRNTDYNVAISMTPEMRLQQKRRFSQPKVRLTQGFGTFMTDVKLGICMYKQVARRNV